MTLHVHSYRVASLAAAIVATLTWSAPTQDAGHTGSCPIGCRDTSSAGVITGLAGYHVWEHHQSETWAMFGATIFRTLHGLQDALWPIIREEAAFHLVATLPASATSYVIADTLHGREYSVTSFDPAGNESCISNEVVRP